jgi:hypothetical protein
MDRSNDRTQTQRIWKALSEAGLVEIKPDEFPAKIKKVKHVAILWLGELLERRTAGREKEIVARSLGTLKRLEAAVRIDDPQPAARASDANETRDRGEVGDQQR